MLCPALRPAAIDCRGRVSRYAPIGREWRDNLQRFALLGWFGAHLTAGDVDDRWQPHARSARHPQRRRPQRADAAVWAPLRHGADRASRRRSRRYGGRCTVGFVFLEPESTLTTALQQAIDVFRKPALWQARMREGMRRDHGWSSAASHYITLYQTLLQAAASPS